MSVKEISTAQTERRKLRFPVAALLLAGVPFFIGGLLVIQTDTPPSESPLLGMGSHALWTVGTVLVTSGVVALLRWIPELRRELAGYFAAGALGLGVLHGLQWTTWAYVDVRGSTEVERTELLLTGIVVPFGAGHLLTYAILMGTGMALFGWALQRTTLVRRSVGIVGTVLGLLTVLTATYPLLFALGGGSDGHLSFDIATLLLPVLYIWAMVVGIGIARRKFV